MDATGADDINRLLARLTEFQLLNSAEGLSDLRDAISLTVALTLGLIVGAAPMLTVKLRLPPLKSARPPRP
jgi:hypothetical protein